MSRSQRVRLFELSERIRVARVESFNSTEFSEQQISLVDLRLRALKLTDSINSLPTGDQESAVDKIEQELIRIVESVGDTERSRGNLLAQTGEPPRGDEPSFETGGGQTVAPDEGSDSDLLKSLLEQAVSDPGRLNRTSAMLHEALSEDANFSKLKRMIKSAQQGVPAQRRHRKSS
jgi:hypothetical protein